MITIERYATKMAIALDYCELFQWQITLTFLRLELSKKNLCKRILYVTNCHDLVSFASKQQAQGKK